MESSIPVALTATLDGHTASVVWHRTWVGPMIGGSQGAGTFTFPDGKTHGWTRNMRYSDAHGDDEIVFTPPIEDEDAQDFAEALVFETAGQVGDAQAEASYHAMTAVCPTDPPQVTA